MPHCHALPIATAHSLYIALFMAALLGSVSHCIGMCGPFVMAQATGFAVPEGKNPATWYRALLLPYHLGRLTTYTLLGMLATMLATPLLENPHFKIIPSLMLVIAAVIFLISAFSRLFPTRLSAFNLSFCGMPSWISEKIARLLPENSLFSGYLLGIILGFLPCGLVYAAIIAVAATGNIWQAMGAMMLFALGTMPALMLIGVSGKWLHYRINSWIKPLSAILMILNSTMLFIMAGKGFL